MNREKQLGLYISSPLHKLKSIVTSPSIAEATSKHTCSSYIYFKMRFALVFVLAFVAFSHQQLQKARLTPWMTSYSSFVNKYQPLYYESDVFHQQDVPFFRFSRPIRPSPSYLYSLLQNGDLSEGSQENAVETGDEYRDTMGRINGFNDAQERFFYGTTINNPFYKTATFTVSSTVTTLASIVTCVPSNNLAAVPSPTCNGRRKRENEDPEDQQFPIVPSETLKLAPTVLWSSDPASHHQLAGDNRHNLLSSKDDGSTTAVQVASSQEDQQLEPNNYREKRLFSSRGGIAASTTLTVYSFVGATLTSTVILDPTSKNVAVCLPAGYIVCAK